MQDETPEYLKKYKKDPLDILGERVLPPTYPKGVKIKKLSNIAGTINKGRPAKYPCAEALQYAVDLYFERFDRTIPRDEEWHKRYPSTYPTVPGLVYALGLASKDELKRQAQRDEGFKFVVEEAFTRIETVKNDLLLQGGSTTTGAMHDLVNHHGWTTKVEQNTTVNAGSDLAALVQALQGKVLRPVLPINDDEEIEDAEYAETETYAEEVDEETIQSFPTSEEYAEDGEITDDIEDLL
jgi:hypothetical protein